MVTIDASAGVRVIRDREAGAVSVRLHHGGRQGAKPKAEVVAEILARTKERWVGFANED